MLKFVYVLQCNGCNAANVDGELLLKSSLFLLLVLYGASHCWLLALGCDSRAISHTYRIRMLHSLCFVADKT